MRLIQSLDYHDDDAQLPEQQMLQKFTARFGAVADFDVSFYHGSCVRRPDSFWQKGILNLANSIETIFEEILPFLPDDYSKFSISDLIVLCKKKSPMLARISHT
jgi:hypothetical protein